MTLPSPPRYYILLFTALFLITVVVFSLPASAQTLGPDRDITVVKEVTQYRWWLIPWGAYDPACEIYVEHEGLPELWEIYYYCDEDLFEAWTETPPCAAAAEEEDTSSCEGYYLHAAGTNVIEREVVESLPPAEIWISLEGCWQEGLTYHCIETPRLIFTAEEPLPEEYIRRIRVEIEGSPYSCESDRCEIPLNRTPNQTFNLEFWAESSYGDQTELGEALVRMLTVEPLEQTETDLLQLDVLSKQWKGAPPPTCSIEWQAFPPAIDIPTWLTTPEDPEALSTNEPYELLASRLLRWGLVEAPDCPFGGLLADGSASVCGVEATRDTVDYWQDRFDTRILEVAVENALSPYLIKGVFAQETQFWPGGFPNLKEYGLGSLHEGGGDSLLLLNTSFYQEFCPLVLLEETCEKPYYKLEEESQELLRGALAIQADVSCPECVGGIDLDKAEHGVDLFGQILQVNCVQAGGVVQETVRRSPGEVATYDDLWRFTLVNYNAGPGCLQEALRSTARLSKVLSWDLVSAELLELEACDATVDYVERVTWLWP